MSKRFSVNRELQKINLKKNKAVNSERRRKKKLKNILETDGGIRIELL